MFRHNHVLILFLVVFLISGSSKAQIIPPYFNQFDKPEDVTGWSHKAITGTDDWELGVPENYRFTSAYSAPNAWVTGLKTDYAGYSNRVLETPGFNFSQIGSDIVLSFYQKTHSVSSGAFYYLEYSIDGINWLLLDDTNAKKKNWQGTSGFSGSSSLFINSAINLSFLQGYGNVKFRFRFVSNYANGEGWLIDDFNISKEYTNIYATQGDSIFSSQKCSDILVKSVFGFENQYGSSFTNTTRYYLSKDAVIDPADELLGTQVMTLSSTFDNYSQVVNLPPGLKVGNYFVLYRHDALNQLEEHDEIDNTHYAALRIDSIYNLPFEEDFEVNIEPWKAYAIYKEQAVVWDLGSGYRHHIEGTHSGRNAWHTSKTIDFATTDQYVESPYFKLAGTNDDLVLHFWFKNHMVGNLNTYNVEVTKDCGKSWSKLTALPPCREDEWDFLDISLNGLSAEENVKFRIKFTTSHLKPEGIIFDDIYVGKVKPDLSIERDKSNHFSPSSETITNLHYLLINSGKALAPETVTAFYWSKDSIFDKEDLLLGLNAEKAIAAYPQSWASFSFTKPTTAPGKYFILYHLDSEEKIDEMREGNNWGYFTLYQESSVATPYLNDFESEPNGWRHNASLGKDDWQWSAPNGTHLDAAFSGKKAWVTNKNPLVSPMSRMHLYTPIFDLSTATKPVLDFDMKLHSHPSCHCFEGKMNMSYSIDGGATWTVLDTTNQSYNRWYYSMEYKDGVDKNYYSPTISDILFAQNERAFTPYTDYNSRDSKRTTKYILDLSFLAGNPAVQFRYNLATLVNNSESPNYPVEGAMIDNFSITEAFVDLHVDYKKSLMISSLSKQIKFFMHIKNQGNYISKSGITKFYLSPDTELTGDDFLLGEINTPAIRPDLYHYLNTVFNVPEELMKYKYLIYELDASNTVVESDEANNIGYWELGLEGASGSSYFNDFNEPVVDGWHQYSIIPFTSNLGNYRMRNILAPGELVYRTGVQNGEWFTERLPSGSYNTPPYFYLESPTFSFEESDSISLSFDMMCTGISSYFNFDGGNFQVSLDGGNTWEILTKEHGEATNWYNYDKLNNLDNEPGWSGPPNLNQALLIPRSIDISFLRGKRDVVFRFKYKSNWEYYGGGTTQGLRVDNFKIESFNVDYVANEQEATIYVQAINPTFNINYSISNVGNKDGTASATKFYWSKDAIFDANDSLIRLINEPIILQGTTLQASLSLTFLSTLHQEEYYVFFVSDANDEMVEINELNNMGSFKISTSSLPNYFSDIRYDTVYLLQSVPFISVPYSIINKEKVDGAATKTGFYWSNDDTFNEEEDALIYLADEEPIQSEGLIQRVVDIPWPAPITQAQYFLFYKADNENAMVEVDENDNVGVFKILQTEVSSIQQQPEANLDLYVYNNNLYVKSIHAKGNNISTLKIVSVSGSVMGTYSITINEGVNSYQLPERLPSGMYMFIIYKGDNMKVKKGIIQH